MLTAVFKDYLIFDDIYEFLEKFYSQKTSLKLIKAYATSQQSIACQKYGLKTQSAFFYKEHENITNRPNYVLFSPGLKKLMYNNLRLKYLMKYEKRVQERDQQKKLN